jgi:hypothetical protein
VSGHIGALQQEAGPCREAVGLDPSDTVGDWLEKEWGNYSECELVFPTW